jgi:hypothetical protein
MRRCSRPARRSRRAAAGYRIHKTLDLPTDTVQFTRSRGLLGKRAVLHFVPFGRERRRESLEQRRVHQPLAESPLSRDRRWPLCGSFW